MNAFSFAPVTIPNPFKISRLLCISIRISKIHNPFLSARPVCPRRIPHPALVFFLFHPHRQSVELRYPAIRNAPAKGKTVSPWTWNVLGVREFSRRQTSLSIFQLSLPTHIHTKSFPTRSLPLPRVVPNPLSALYIPQWVIRPPVLGSIDAVRPSSLRCSVTADAPCAVSAPFFLLPLLWFAANHGSLFPALFSCCSGNCVPLLLLL